jgi:hypothetical protein
MSDTNETFRQLKELAGPRVKELTDFIANKGWVSSPREIAITGLAVSVVYQGVIDVSKAIALARIVEKLNGGTKPSDN